MLKEMMLIALLVTGDPVQEIVDGETCQALYDAIEDGKRVTKELEDGREISLILVSCIPLEVFNSVQAEKPR